MTFWGKQKMNSLEKLQRDIDSISNSSVKEIETEIIRYLDRTGVFYKTFMRVKKSASIHEKLVKKTKEKGVDYKMQDLIGVRIVLYFKEDIVLCEKIINEQFKVIDVAKNIELPDRFCPMRNNIVCRLPDAVIKNLDPIIWNYPIDQTFEIQLRTVFSEGWHEVEHDFRYKCKNSWENMDNLGRTLNGIIATLDNCDWAMESLLDEKAYCHYKNKEWEDMIRNKLRIRLKNNFLNKEIVDCFTNHPVIAKEFFRANRIDFLLKMTDVSTPIPLTLDNVIYLLNEFQIHNDIVGTLTPDIIKEKVKNVL